MAKKTLGYVELEWTCTRCGTVNPGTQKTCTNCGAAMSDKEQFELPEQQQLITEEAAMEKAGKGPDVHCSYCGTRNPAGAETCSQCGGDLKGAQARQEGRVLGALSTAPKPEVPCPSCGTPNPAGSPRCRNCGGSLAAKPSTPPAQPAATAAPKGRFPVIAIVAIVVLCLGALMLLLLGLRTEEQAAVVQGVQWQRSIEILEERPVEYEDWQDQIPAGADIGSCEQRHRSTQLEPAPGAREVCGTPYTVDQGSGMAEVVQDCEYEIYDDWCTFSQIEWVVVDISSLTGSDVNPEWPALSLSTDQRAGERTDQYVVLFQSGDETYTLTISDPEEFARFSPGSQWELEVNSFGSITNFQER